jgi:uncharacterized protein YegL
MKKTIRTKRKSAPVVVNVILDKSGSMESCKEGTIAGFNKYIRDLQKKGGDIRFSLTLFDTISIEKPYVDVPIEKVKLLNSETYKPAGGTPLYDAVIDATEACDERVSKMEVKPAVLNVIMTDGEENSSTRHDEECLSDYRGKLEKQGNWTFVFLGANQDSFAKARVLGIAMGNTSNFRSDNIGMMAAMADVSANSVNFVANAQKGLALNTSNFFDKGGK